MKKVSIDKVFDLLSAIPDISELEMCPSIFTDDYDKNDCDTCKFSKFNMGDDFDPDTCKSCWQNAIIEGSES